MEAGAKVRTLIKVSKIFQLQNPPSGFRIGTLKDSSFEKFFQGTDDPTLSRIWQHMKHNSVKDFAEAIKQMNSG